MRIIEVPISENQALITVVVSKELVTEEHADAVAPLIAREAEQQYRSLVKKHG